MDVLITGMSQLQQVLLRQRGDVLDLEPKAVTELVKLPEYTVGDRGHRLSGLPVPGGAADWDAGVWSR